MREREERRRQREVENKWMKNIYSEKPNKNKRIMGNKS